MRMLVEFKTGDKARPRYFRYFRSKDHLCKYLIEEDGNYESYKIIAERHGKKGIIGID